MPDIRFYHLTRSTMEVALPAMLSKTLERGGRALVMAENADMVQTLNHHLWVYNDRAFLPHGTSKEGFGEDQPIWLTSEDENPNKADYLFLLGQADNPSIADFAVSCVLFDGNNSHAVEYARNRWRTLKDRDLPLTYWQQGGNGWEQKA